MSALRRVIIETEGLPGGEFEILTVKCAAPHGSPPQAIGTTAELQQEGWKAQVNSSVTRRPMGRDEEDDPDWEYFDLQDLNSDPDEFEIEAFNWGALCPQCVRENRHIRAYDCVVLLVDNLPESVR